MGGGGNNVFLERICFEFSGEKKHNGHGKLI